MTQNKTNYIGPFLTMVFLFLIVGFLTTANTQFQGPLKEALLQGTGRLQNTFATLITFSWFLAYPLAGPVGSRWVNRYGYKGTLLRGLIVMAAGLFLSFCSSWLTVHRPEALVNLGDVHFHSGFLVCQNRFVFYRKQTFCIGYCRRILFGTVLKNRVLPCFRPFCNCVDTEEAAGLVGRSTRQEKKYASR